MGVIVSGAMRVSVRMRSIMGMPVVVSVVVSVSVVVVVPVVVVVTMIMATVGIMPMGLMCGWALRMRMRVCRRVHCMRQRVQLGMQGLIEQV